MAIRQLGPTGVVVVLVVVPPATIWTPTFVLWVRDPLVPVTDSVKVPVDAEEPAPTESVEVPVPPEGGVTGPGNVMDTSDGAVPIHE